ncbi:PH domain protein [Oesophagostomum dentatum]|uniref:PH domain protein n=1 Tax=Oesophagostomum dentatum TaxID=61180 RepID=A0A0B1TRE9_OESDE|nr:PH domain protein [Oesophagostomum dentatum]
MERKETIALLSKLNLTARSTFYSFEEVPDTPPAIKVFKRVPHPVVPEPPMCKKISNVSTCSLKSTKSLAGGFSYLAGDVPSKPHTVLSLPVPNLPRSNSVTEHTSDGTPKPKRKLRRRSGFRRVVPKKKTSQFYAPAAEIPIHLPHTEMFQHFSGMPPDPDVMMEGYLYKRSSNAFKTWNRRWFQIKDNKLLYTHRSADSEQPTVMEENLMLCLVRPAPSSIDRVGCFELVTPTSKSENRKSATDVTNTKSGVLAVADAATTFEQIRRVPGNERCADCGSEQPKWVSINLGVVLCIECSGVHRSLGVQTSKVRSLTMDSIDPELRDVLLSLGNSQVNAIFLAHLPDKDVVPQPAVDNSNRQLSSFRNFRNTIKFARLGSKQSTLSGGLPYLLVSVLEVVLLREWNIFPDIATALLELEDQGQTAAVEFLLLNGAKINVLDEKLNTPLHLAAAEGNTLQVCQLLKRGADKSLKNADGVTPLEIAVEGKHADIVTLFRVHTMRDEFNEEFNNPMDDTVDSVISDITPFIYSSFFHLYYSQFSQLGIEKS